MEYGLVKDTTLQALADSLRAKEVIPMYEKVLVPPARYMSGNATSLDDPTPASRQWYGSQPPLLRFDAKPDAAAVRAIITVGYYEDPEETNPSREHRLMFTYQGTVVHPDVIISRNSARQFIVDLPPTAVYIAIADGAPYGAKVDWIALNVTAYELDEKGNERLVDTENINKVSPEGMVEAIVNMPALVPESAFNLSGVVDYRFIRNAWNWFLERYPVTTDSITSMNNFFSDSSELTKLPFDVINVKDCSGVSNAFSNMSKLEKCPKIRGTLQTAYGGPSGMDSIIYRCWRLRDVEDLFEPDMLDYFQKYKVTSAYSCSKALIFNGCYSLRKVPSWFYKFRLNEESTTYPYQSYCLYYNLFYNCYALDEARDVPVYTCKGAQTSNMFNNTVYSCYRLKEFTFETNDGQPIVANWKSQTIDFTPNVGFGGDVAICDYNSGITRDKQVSSDTGYQALKNDPDWWTTDAAYSRYNHDSAVETINSLPDTSAYLASAGGTNTIKFKKTSGSKTDGGAIENLTAEEIAVAAAKGWTVTLS